MKEILLTQGKVALVNDDDFVLLGQFKWYAHRQGCGLWYAERKTPGEDGSFQRSVLMHRVILDAPLGVDVDHKNGNGLDNQRSNLRSATRQQNSQNRSVLRHSRSGYKGLGFHAKTGKWQAQIGVGGRVIYIGLFDRPEDAARAYDAEARRRFGDYARLNFPVSDAETAAGI